MDKVIDIIHNNAKEGLYEACQEDHINIVDLMVDLGVYNYNDELYKACREGHMDTVKLMIEKGANDWNSGLYYACYIGHMDIVKLMIEKGANNWNSGLTEACEGGHMDIVKLMIDKGADNFTDGLVGACRGNHINIAILMIDMGGHCFNGLTTACCKGRLNIVEMIIEKNNDPATKNKLGDYYWYSMLSEACYGGNINIVNLIIDISNKNTIHKYAFHTGDWIIGLRQASQNNAMDVVKLMIDKGANNVSCYYSYPIDHQYIIVLLELGLSIDNLKTINGYDILINNLKQFKEATYNELYQYMPKEFAKLVSDYCLL